MSSVTVDPIASVRAPRILVIEDDGDFLENLAALLQAENYQVLTATSGEMGLARATSHRPDLILCDVGMPGMDGFEVLRQLRVRAETRRTPILMITAFADRRYIRRGMTLGADDYISKPFTADEILEAIRQRMARFNQITESYRRTLRSVRDGILYTLPDRVRNSLSVILIGLDYLTAGQPQDAECQRVCLDMTRSTDRIRQALDRFTDMVHLLEPSVQTDAGETQEQVDLAPLIRGVAEHLADKHKRNDDLRIRLRNFVAAGNQDCIQTALRELLDNAFRHTKPGTRVIVATRSTISGIQVMVGDRGNGFGEWVAEGKLRETQPRDVFAYNKPGIGLGLAQLACWSVGCKCTFANARRGGAIIRLDLRHASRADRYF